VWRWAEASASSSLREPAPLPATAPSESPWPPAPFALVPPEPLPVASYTLEPDPSMPFVMDIDPSRVLLRQRRDDIPPPPAFVFRAFRRSRPEVQSDPEHPVIVGQTVDVSSSESSRQQVRRGSRVDVAPCLAVGTSAALAPPVLTLVTTEPSVRSDPERPRSRRTATARRGPISSPLPDGDELHQAIRELESAFGERVALAGS
jgi:hypothetical protein